MAPIASTMNVHFAKFFILPPMSVYQLSSISKICKQKKTENRSSSSFFVGVK